MKREPDELFRRSAQDCGKPRGPLRTDDLAAFLDVAEMGRRDPQLFGKGGLGQFFTVEAGLLRPREPGTAGSASLKAQYDAVARAYPEALVACQVGCWYEWYDAAAERAMKVCGLNPVRPRRGFDCQCGVPLRLWGRILPRLLTLRLPLCVMRETDESLGAVNARRVAEYWQPTPRRFQRPVFSDN